MRTLSLWNHPDAHWQRIDLPDADVSLVAAWLAPDEADVLLHTLQAELPWERHRLRLFGREVQAPRLSCWIGDPGMRYTYSGTTFQPVPWPDALAALRERVGEACGATFNSVLANLYRDGDDAMGWHSDDEPELGSRPVIASVSLGAPRRFLLKPRHRQARSTALPLPHGSLLRMAGDTQANYRHALPRTRRPVGPRLNLTFRRIAG